MRTMMLRRLCTTTPAPPRSTMASKRDIVHCSDLLFEISQQASPPSKNFHHLAVNPLGVVFRTWHIDAQTGIHHHVSNAAEETAVTLREFVEEEELNDAIRFALGQDVLDKALKAARDAL
eukprot:m.22882 g.22882  ORF g.22882 m.22882 type:complete len:120 (+) comp4038_c0_seq1:2339-2698(+)